MQEFACRKFVLLVLLLAGCTQWLGDDRLRRLTRKEIARAHTIKAYMIRDDSHPPIARDLGVIEGISCQMTRNERKASTEEAIAKLSLSASSRGGDGVVGIHHIVQPEGETIGNCLSIAMLRGIAVKFSKDQ